MSDSSLGRSEARKQAVEFIYAAEVRGVTAVSYCDSVGSQVDAFTKSLLEAYDECCTKADSLISENTSGWDVKRMPTTDVVIMRLAISDHLALDTPNGVVIAEAVSLAETFSTDDSSRFVNGVLSKIIE